MSSERSVEAELLELEEQLLMPAVRHSKDALASLLADSFLEFGSSGRVFDRQQVIESLSSEVAVRLSLSDSKVVLLGPDVALVTYRAARYSDEGQIPVESLRSSLWQRREGRWQILFHQGTETRP